MTEPELQALIERAAEAGARHALASVGLHDEDAGMDVQELRSLLETWRDTMRTSVLNSHCSNLTDCCSSS